MHSSSCLALVASCAMLACSDATRARPATTLQSYVLVSVDGRAVPAVVDSGAVGWLDVLDGSLSLQTGDSAKEVFHALDVSVQFGTEDELSTRASTYRITGDSIEVGFFGACPDLCIPNRIGRYEDTLITLTDEVFPPNNPMYTYRRIPTSAPQP